MVIKRIVSLCAAAICLAATTPLEPATATPYFRNPVILSVAPDAVDCDDPDDPDNVEDVQIAGICFRGDIVSAFLSTSTDGMSGSRVDLSNVVNVANNVVTATVPLAELDQSAVYYVFVVRGFDGKQSTAYPNAFGFDVTFRCVDTTATGPPNPPGLTSCKVVRTDGGRFVLQVNGVGFIAGTSIVLIDGAPCQKNKYPRRYINPSDATTTRINCSGNIKRLLPAVVTVQYRPGVVSDNSLNCNLE
jgi:hypothetical protein